MRGHGKRPDARDTGVYFPRSRGFYRRRSGRPHHDAALKLSDGGLRLLVWLPVIFGGFAAGGIGAGFAPDLKLPCGLLPALLLWAAVLLLQQEYGLMELLRGGVILLSGGVGAAAFSQGRKKFKPGKGRPGMRRARPRKGPF